MSKKYTFTLEELSVAFDKWNSDFLNNPENYSPEREVEVGDGIDQAKILVKFLEK